MVKMLRSAMSIIAVCCIAVISNLHGQTGVYPFPQSANGYTYQGGIMPDGVSTAAAQQAYEDWRDEYIASTGACGERRVIFDYYPGTTRGATDKSVTVSEGIAYGMLLSAYYDDQALFDDLWSYYKKNSNGNGVMNWRIQNCSVYQGSYNGASDAELDVAMALIIASYQWQSDTYENDARNMIRIVRQHEIESGSYVLKPGDAFGGSNLCNPSYFSPAYYRVFKDFDPGYETFWDNVTTKGYQIIDLAGGTTGVVPDWCNASGGFSGDQNGYEDDGRNFIYDGVRTPFRSAMDYLWHGANAPEAKAYCEKFTTWAMNNHGSANDIGDKYASPLTIGANEGDKLSFSNNNTFVGCFGIAAMAAGDGLSTQSWTNSCYNRNNQLDPQTGFYFNASFKAMTMLIMSGNWWLPPPDACTSPDLGADKSLCQSSPVTLDASLSGYSYVWKRNQQTIAGATSGTYNASLSGEYTVIATENGTGCTRRDKVNVYDAALDADFVAVVQGSIVILTNTSTGGYSETTWEVDGSSESNDVDYTTGVLTEGSHEITLTVDRVGFGCSSAPSSITKTIVVGGGEGWRADDFNDWDFAEAWVGGAAYGAVPRNWCSADARDAGDPKDCYDFPCSLLEVEVLGGDQYSPFGVNFREDGAAITPDIDAVPFVTFKARASSAVSLGVAIGDGNLSTNRIFESVTTDWQVFTVDFTGNKTGYLDAANPSYPVDFTAATAVQFFPMEDDATWSGTIEIDWITVGGKTLAPPAFDLKRDADNLLIYEDPDGDEVYTTVSSWTGEALDCDGTGTVVTAEACSAEEIRWYSGTTLVGTGSDSPALSAGTYFVDLIGQGGITRDTLVVTGANVQAGFSYTVEDLGKSLRLENTSTDFDTWEWSYGTTPGDPDAVNWEQGYNYYDVDGDYEVCIEVTNETCSETDTYCETITIECTAPLGEFAFNGTPAIVDDTLTTCPVAITVSTDSVDYGATYGWYDINGDDIGDMTDEVTFTPTTSYWLKAEAYNICGDAVADSVYIEVIPAAVANFTASQNAGLDYHYTADWIGDEPGATYSWDFDDDGIEDATGVEVDYTFPAGGIYDVTLTVTNACGTDDFTDQVGCNLPDVSGGVITGADEVCEGDGCTAYEVTGITGATGYTWAAPGSVCTGQGAASVTADITISGNLEVTATNTCGSAAAVVLPITLTSTPAISAATATPDDACVGDDIDLSVTGSAAYTYAWSGPDLASSALQNPTVSGVTTSGTYSVTATENGCASTPLTVPVTVNPVPTVTALTSDADNIVCEGDMITLTGGGDADTYTWDNGVDDGVAFAATATTTYTVTGTTGTCSDQASVTITVNPAASLTGISGATTIDCATDETYTVLPSANANSTYSWTLPDASSQTGASITIALTSGGTLSVTETTEDGCTALASEAITVNTCPDAVANFTADMTSGCGTLDATFTSTSSGTDGDETYSWDFDGDGVEDETGEGPHIFSYTTSGTYTVELTITDPISGTDTETKTNYITVNDIPDITSISPEVNICAGTQLDLTAGASSPTATIEWSATNGYLGTGANVTVAASAAVANSGTYTATATENGCSGTTMDVDVTVNPAATVSGISGPSTIDCNSDETYTVLPSVNATSTYSWTLPDASTETGSSITIALTSGGTLEVEETTAGGCTRTAQTTINVNACTGAVPAFSSDATSGCGSLDVTFTDLSTGLDGNETFSWDFDGDGIEDAATQGTQTFTYSTPGTYTVSYTITDAITGALTETKTDYITVGEVPTVSMVSTPISGCAGGAISLEATSSAGATVNWTTDAASGYTGTGNMVDVTTSATVNDAGTYTATAELAGCESTPATVDVTVYPGASVTAIDKPSGVLDCGAQYEFSVTPSVNPTSTYDWTLPNGNTATGAPVDLVNTQNGTLTLTETTDQGCEKTVTTSIAVNVCNGPIADFTADIENGCDSESITFTDASTNTDGSETYEWDFDGDGTFETSGIGPHTIDFTTLGSFTVGLRVTDGGSGLSNENVKTDFITISETPTLSSVSSDVNICSGQALELTATSTPATTIEWTSTNGYTGTSNSGELLEVAAAAAVADGGTYTATAVSNGCSSTSMDVEVVVNQTPTTTAISGASPADCQSGGNSYSVANNAGSTYTWSTTGGLTITGGAGTSSVIVDVAGYPGIIEVVESNNGCAAAPVSMTVAVDLATCPQEPVADFEMVPDASTAGTAICAGESIEFTSTSSAGGTYSWDFSTAGTPATESTVGPHTVTYDTEGEHEVSISVTAPAGAPNGAEATYIQDDFEQDSPYSNESGTRGVYWWPSPASSKYELVRENGKMSVNCTAADPTYLTFGLGFGTGQSVDLSGGAVMSLDVTNTHATEEAVLTFSLKDANGVQLEIQADTSVNKDKFIATIPANGSQTIIFDWEGAWKVEGWACSNFPVDCPSLDKAASAAFDWTQVTDIGMHVNGGAGTDIPNDPFTGTLLFDNFILGTPVSAGTSTVTATKSVFVNPSPEITSVTPDFSVCDGSPIELSATADSPTATIAWTTDAASGYVGAGADVTVTSTATTDDGGTYSAIATENGCESAPADVTVTYDPCDFARADFTADVTEGCSPSFMVTFTSTSIGTDGNETYSWDVDNDGTPDYTGVGPHTHEYTASGMYAVSLSVTDPDNPSTVDTETKVDYINVIDGALGATGDITGETSVCDNQSNVTYSIAAVTGATDYLWTVPTDATIVSGQGTTSITVDFGTSVGDIEVTPSNACGDGTPATATIDVGANTVTPAVAIDHNGEICTDEVVSFTATATNVGGLTPEYYWSVNGVENPTSMSSFNNNNTALVDGDELSVRIVTDFECASPKTATDMLTIVEANNAATPVITGPNIINECPATSLVMYSIEPVENSVYHWSIGAGTGAIITDSLGNPQSSNFTNEIFVDFSAYNGAVTTVGINASAIACGRAANAKGMQVSICTPTAIGDKLNGAELKVYPNPFAETSNVNVISDSEQEYQLVIYNAVSGLTVYEGEQSTNEAVEVGEDWTSGLYIGQAIFEGGVITFKIEKSR